jgi:hypothetical protein
VKGAQTHTSTDACGAPVLSSTYGVPVCIVSIILLLLPRPLSLPSLRCRNPVSPCMDELIIPHVSYPHLSEAILLVEILLHLHRTHHLFSKLPCFALSHQELLPTILHCSIPRTHAGRMPADFMPSPLIVRRGVHVCLHAVSFHCSAECVSILCERDFETPFIETTCARRTSNRVTHPYVSIVRYRWNLEVPGRHI